METPNSLSERRSTQWPWRRKYRAASQGNSPIRLLDVRTTSSAPEVTYNKTVWHVPSKHNSAAPTPALARLRYQYHAYIIMLWKDHGHKGRGTTTGTPRMRLNRTRGCRFFNFLLLLGLHSSEGLFGSLIAAQTMQEPGRQTSHAALRNSQVVSITSNIPVSHTFPQPALERTC